MPARQSDSLRRWSFGMVVEVGLYCAAIVLSALAALVARLVF